MKGFRRFLAEMTHYHGTTKANADSILRTGLDPKRYQSGMFRGVYLTPNLDYFGGRQPEAILAVELDDSAVLDVRDVTDADLEAIDPGYRSMSYGYRNSLIEKVARAKGKGAIRNGKEVVVIDPAAVQSVRPYP